MTERTMNGKTVWRETKTALKIFQTSTFPFRANQISTFRLRQSFATSGPLEPRNQVSSEPICATLQAPILTF